MLPWFAERRVLDELKPPKLAKGPSEAPALVSEAPLPMPSEGAEFWLLDLLMALGGNEAAVGEAKASPSSSSSRRCIPRSAPAAEPNVVEPTDPPENGLLPGKLLSAIAPRLEEV